MRNDTKFWKDFLANDLHEEDDGYVLEVLVKLIEEKGLGDEAINRLLKWREEGIRNA